MRGTGQAEDATPNGALDLNFSIWRAISSIVGLMPSFVFHSSNKCLGTHMTSEAESVAQVEELEEEHVEEPLESSDNAIAPSLPLPPLFSRPVNPLVVSKRWKEFHDPATNRSYYFDRITKGVQWRKPTGFLSRAELLRPVSASQIGTSDWQVVGTISGRDYFYNSKTGTTAWELPEDFNTPIPAKAAPEAEVGDSKKRAAEEDPEEVAPEPKRRKLAIEGRPATFVGLFEDTIATAADNFKRMLEAFEVDKNATWQDWQAKLSTDGRFNAVVSLAERRSLFDAYVRQIAINDKKKREKDIEDAKNALKDEIEFALAEQKSWRGFDDFKDIFRPTEAYQHLRDLHPDSIGDVYDDFTRKESEDRKKLRDRAKRDFLGMLEEKVREKYERDTRKDWLDFKLELEDDPRYNRAQLSGGDREALFEDFAREVRHSLAPRSRSDSNDRKRDEYEDRGRESQHDRRHDGGRSSSSNDKQRREERGREQRQEKMEDREIREFKSLLADKVQMRSTNAKWEEIQPMLVRDPRFDTQYIGTKSKIQLFEQHVKDLKQSAERQFWRSLETHGNGDFYLTWAKACDALAGTPALSLLPSNTEREAAYKKWALDQRQMAETDLNRLFKSTRSIKAGIDMENEEEMDRIVEELKKDSRWRALPDSSSGWEMRRMDLLGQYIDSLSEDM